MAGIRKAAWERQAYRRVLESTLFIFVPIGILGMNWLIVGRPRISYLVGQTMLNVGIALCIDYLLRYSRSAVGRAMNLRFVASIGTLSYSLYLWQQIFLIPDDPAVLGQPFPVDVVLVFGAAWFSYNVIEKPFLSLRHRFAAPKPSGLLSVPAVRSAI